MRFGVPVSAGLETRRPLTLAIHTDDRLIDGLTDDMADSLAGSTQSLAGPPKGGMDDSMRARPNTALPSSSSLLSADVSSLLRFALSPLNRATACRRRLGLCVVFTVSN